MRIIEFHARPLYGIRVHGVGAITVRFAKDRPLYFSQRYAGKYGIRRRHVAIGPIIVSWRAWWHWKQIIGRRVEKDAQSS